MADLTSHQQRIKDELAKAGMTNYGKHKMSSHYLPNILAEDEHIKGVVYGHSGTGLAMLVATDRRIVYLEKRPLFTSTDEVSYEVVVGVRYIKAGLFPAVELHTRMGNYTLTYVNSTCANTFIKYIENRIEHLILDHTDEPRLAANQPPESDPEPVMPAMPSSHLTEPAKDLLRNHQVGVLAAGDRTGSVQGMTVHYMLGSDDNLYIVTKFGSVKTHSLLTDHQVVLTVFDEQRSQSLQLQGYAEAENSSTTRQTVFEQLLKPRAYDNQSQLLDTTELEAAGFMVFKITPVNVTFDDFR